MLKKLLSKSGRRILKAIKKLSTRKLKSKRSQNLSAWHTAIPDLDGTSLSASLPSLDARSIDTYMTYVPETPEECASRCSHCDEENHRNENRENEMIL